LTGRRPVDHHPETDIAPAPGHETLTLAPLAGHPSAGEFLFIFYTTPKTIKSQRISLNTPNISHQLKFIAKTIKTSQFSRDFFAQSYGARTQNFTHSRRNILHTE
jgi:hypothetical protein